MQSSPVPDQLHPKGFQAIGGSRIPLIMFGGQVQQGVESEWHSHASVVKTVIDLLGLPPFGVPRVDQARSLASRVKSSLNRPHPPAFNTPIQQPAAPANPPATVTHPWAGPMNVMMPPLVANGGRKIPAPSDGVVSPKPPKIPTAGHPFVLAGHDNRYTAGARPARGSAGRAPAQAASRGKPRKTSARPASKRKSTAPRTTAATTRSRKK